MNNRDQAEDARFRVKARILSELGDELISSDAIALYELIKNAYDAKADVVEIDVDVPIRSSQIDEALGEKQGREAALLALLAQTDLERHEDLSSAILGGDVAVIRDLLVSEVRRRSEIKIKDDGQGMNRTALEDGFLSIASSLRYRQRAEEGDRPILGSKGVGRFSTKRLGSRLRLDTTGDDRITYHLDIDWTPYAPASELYLDQVHHPLWSEPANGTSPGTELTISDLNDVWSEEKLRDIARDQLSKLMNPFFPTDFIIATRFNGAAIDLRELQTEVLEYARLRIEGTVDPVRNPPVVYELWYEGSPVLSPVQREMRWPTSDELRRVGPFRFAIYEFNRTSERLKELNSATQVSALLDTWGGGGLMLFRDGFRVMPYGTPELDWLGIDQRFFSPSRSQSANTDNSGTRSKIQLRTKAMLGYVAINSTENPSLVDQTNREGLRDNAAKKIFLATLSTIIDAVNLEFARLGPEGKRRQVAPIARELANVRQDLDSSTSRAINLVDQISESSPSKADTAELKREVRTVRQLARSYVTVADRLQRRGSVSANAYQVLLELAGLGMAAEQAVHELNSLLDRARGLLDGFENEITAAQKSRLGQVKANLGSIRGFLDFLDPLTQASRQDRETIDLATVFKDVADHYPAITEKRVKIQAINLTPGKRLQVRASRGILMQVFDNLIANSLYWLEAARSEDPTISIRVDAVQRTVDYSDNGPGIDPDFRDLIFEPFISTKPKGRGLGLFIARELLEFEGWTLSLERASDSHERLRHFFIDLGQRPDQR